MNVLLVVITIFLGIVLGYLLVDRFLPQIKDNFVKIGVGFGFVFGMSCILTLIQYVVKIYPSGIGMLAFYILPVLFLLTDRKAKKFKGHKKNSHINRIVLLITILLVGFVFLESTIRPMTAWDGWASWQVRAKAMYIDKEISRDQFVYLETEYPLFVPLYSVFIYSVIGSVDDTAVLLVSFTCYLLIGIACFGFVRQQTSAGYGLVISFLILSAQNFIRHGGRYEAGMADIVISLFVLLTIILLSYFRNTKDKTILIAIFITLGITSQIKNEGIIFSILSLGVVGYYLHQFKMMKYFLFSAICLLGLVSWQLAKHIYQLPTGILSPYPKISFENTIGIFIAEVREFMNVKNWNLGWFFAIFVFLYTVVRKKIDGLQLLIIIHLISYFVVFFFSSVDPVLHARGIIDRLLLHVFPAAVTIAAVNSYTLIRNNRYIKKLKLV